MPLYVKIAHAVSVNDTLWYIRNKLQGTYFDPTVDVGGEQWHTAERLAQEGTTFTVEGSTYMNNRPIGVPYTGWGIVSQMRPKERFGVLWSSVGDSSFSP